MLRASEEVEVDVHSHRELWGSGFSWTNLLCRFMPVDCRFCASIFHLTVFLTITSFIFLFYPFQSKLASVEIPRRIARMRQGQSVDARTAVNTFLLTSNTATAKAIRAAQVEAVTAKATATVTATLKLPEVEKTPRSKTRSQQEGPPCGSTWLEPARWLGWARLGRCVGAWWQLRPARRAWLTKKKRLK